MTFAPKEENFTPPLLKTDECVEQAVNEEKNGKPCYVFKEKPDMSPEYFFFLVEHIFLIEQPAASLCICTYMVCTVERHPLSSCLDLDDPIQGREFLCLNYKAAFTQLITQNSFRYGPVTNAYEVHGIFYGNCDMGALQGKYHRANTAAVPH